VSDPAPWAARPCTRCSMSRHPSSSGQLCRMCFDERAKHTYWDKGEACRATGPTRAECLLDVGHEGDHEGNGFDDHGPIYRCWRAP
jgi:hypothetical protein